jgi:very-short-patch-repair endonuclease
MNEIESRLFEEFNKVLERYKNEKGYAESFPYLLFFLNPQEIIGIYKVDFLYNDCVVEIDGDESHKTKEQREYDYVRERYLMKKGYKIIRFMGTEVFLDPHKCVMEIIEIGDLFQRKHDEVWRKGFKRGQDYPDYQD